MPQNLSSRLRSLDNKSYGAYKSITGRYSFDSTIEISIDHVQSDPFAPPSLVRAFLPLSWLHPTGHEEFSASDIQCPAAADYLLRRLVKALPRHGSKDQGFITIDQPGQEIIRRSALQINPNQGISVCCEVALPARGRRIMGHRAADLVTKIFPDRLRQALRLDAAGADELRAAISLYRDQEAVLEYLRAHHLVSFVANGAILPRRSGNSDIPAKNAVAFHSPSTLEHRIELPSGQSISGMGVPEGVTLIVGGGYHGKSTLLKAIELGIYHHIAGDGREFVLTTPQAWALRAEDGRAISGVDISQFIADLPSGIDTRSFSTPDASGSTSQAASLVEALEAGTTALLIDEDTSATNFMLRDSRMAELVPQEREPITPFIHRARALYRDLGVSTVLVAGGSGAFIDVADQVICMDAYHPEDISERAQTLREDIPEQPAFPAPGKRRATIHRSHQRRAKPPKAQGTYAIRDGQETIDLWALSQIVDSSQTAAIATLLGRLEKADDSRTPLKDQLSSLLDAHPSAYSTHKGHPGRLAEVRLIDAMASVNRHRGLDARS